MSEDTCAVWYWRHHSLDYDLYEDEQAAARFAASLEEWENGFVAGVQFSDGRLIKRDGWSAMREEERRRDQESDARMEAYKAVPPTPKRKINPPFTDDPYMEIDAEEPEWLGVQ